MRRIARQHVPGAIFHITARIVNDDLRLDFPGAREEYLRRLGQCLRRTDWRLLSYALMSNHVHLGLEAGEAPARALMHPLQSGFGLWLNEAQRRSGPVWADRFHEALSQDLAYAAEMIAYHHNHPVRAGIAQCAWDSDWTSHRAYVGLAPRPPWLDVARGLALCGLEDTPGGRSAFDERVLLRRKASKDEWLTYEKRARVRSQMRSLTDLLLEAGAPGLVPGEPPEDSGPATVVDREEPTTTRYRRVVPIMVPRERAGAIVVRRPSIDEVIQRAGEWLGVTADAIRGPGRGALPALARKAIAWTWVRHLGGHQTTIAHALRRTRSHWSKLLQLLDEHPEHPARAIGGELARDLLAKLCGPPAAAEPSAHVREGRRTPDTSAGGTANGTFTNWMVLVHRSR